MENNPVQNPNPVIQQPVAAQAPSQLPNEPTKNGIMNSKWLKIGVVVIVLLIFGAGTYLLGKTSNKTQEATAIVSPAPTSRPIQTINPTSSPTLPPDATANWKEFNDQETGISFKYPINWEISKLKDWAFSVLLEDSQIGLPNGASDAFTSISMNFNEEKDTTTGKSNYPETTIDQYVEKTIKGLDLKSVTKDAVLVGGKKAIRLTGIVGPGPYEGTKSTSTIIQLDNKILIVGLNNEKYKDIYDQILSTFRFTN